jgi:hypothetical protein
MKNIANFRIFMDFFNRKGAEQVDNCADFSKLSIIFIDWIEPKKQLFTINHF